MTHLTPGALIDRGSESPHRVDTRDPGRPRLGERPSTRLQGVRQRDAAPAPARMRVLLRPPRGGLRLRADRGDDEPGADRIWTSHDLALRRLPSGAQRGVDRHRRRLVEVDRGASPRRRARTQEAVAEVRGHQPDAFLQGSRRDRGADRGEGVRVQGRCVRGTGNLAGAVAAHAAASGMESVVFIPEGLETGKVAPRRSTVGA